MRFVSIKSFEQQDIQALQRLVQQRTALIKILEGLIMA